MPTEEQVTKMISDLGLINTFGIKKAITYLPEILHEDEVIKYITKGLVDKNVSLITCTNKRVIFLAKGVLLGLKQREMPLNKINSIDHKKGTFLELGEISITDGSSKMTVTKVNREQVAPFVNAVSSAMEEFNQVANSSIVTQGDDAASKIEKLYELSQKGIISKEEFKEKKQNLLDSM